ncbi:hypothetical protein LX32DRAFT_433719 [Colletotrichum zoysiae]|uniref:Uncharacterized protein n=1 Tax=Colletotrichum zoysiae TaxID=1216348 RepID=A0AAD9LYW7_9PEZI|nr:hypothetical protein LX32DRAFT_433719 [Colletotrichum zoysiae]
MGRAFGALISGSLSPSLSLWRFGSISAGNKKDLQLQLMTTNTMRIARRSGCRKLPERAQRWDNYLLDGGMSLSVKSEMRRKHT